MAGFFFVNGKIKNSGDTHSNNRNVISMSYDKITSWLEYGRRKPSRTISPFSNGIIYNTNNRQNSIFSDIKLHTLTESNSYYELK
jgi:hypothetical protein